MSTTVTLLPRVGDTAPTAFMGGSRGDIPIVSPADRVEINLGCHPDPTGWLLGLADQATKLAAVIRSRSLEAAAHPLEVAS